MKKVIILIFPTAVIFFLISGYFVFFNGKVAAAKEEKRRQEVPSLLTVETPLSSLQVEKDCQQLKQLYKTKYAGYKDTISKGFDIGGAIDEACDQSLAVTKVFGEIQVLDFAKNLHDSLLPIDDGHGRIQIISNSNYVKFYLCNQNYVWLTDTYIVKKNGAYEVLSSTMPEIHRRMKYTGTTKNLFLSPAEGANVYRYGVTSAKLQNTVIISLENNQYKVFVHDSDEYVKDTMPYGHITETPDTLYVCLYSFSGTDQVDDERLKQFAKWGAEARQKKNVLIDVRRNKGGFSSYPCIFLSNFLFSDTNTREIFFKQNSDMEYQYRSLFGFSYLSTHKISPQKFTSDYDGKIIVLADKATASAAELLIKLLYETNNTNITLIGSNTAGMLKSANPVEYVLPESKIHVTISQMYGCGETIQNLSHYHGEGNGFYPDYWAMKGNIVNTIKLIIDDDTEFNTIALDIATQ